MACLLSFAASHATETQEPAQTVPASRVGTIWDVSIAKKVKRVNISLQGSIYTLGNSLERAMTIAMADIDLMPQYLRLQILGYYFYHLGTGNQYNHKLRYHIGLGGSIPINPATLTWSTRYESTYTLPKTIPYNRWRTKARSNFKIGSSAWQPFAEVEFFLGLNGKYAGKADRLWYNAGVSYSINPHNKVEFKVREEQTLLTVPKQWNTFIGFAYKIAL